MQKKIDKINKRLSSLFLEENKPHKILYDAINYSLNSKAKRLRPLLTCLICEAYSFDLDIAIDAAIAIELIHTYSLIHDDLPSMDDDDIRRGKLTLHKKYSEWLAILSGDALLTYSFELISNIENLSDNKKIKLINTLSKYSGKDHLIAGQVVDIQSENKKIDFETLKFMHINKTSSLFICSSLFGAILSNASKKDSEILKNFACNLGLAFQIKDDILDIESTKEELGKDIKSDQKKNKSTAVSILGIDKAKKLKDDLLNQILSDLNFLSIDTTSLKEYLNFFF
jgi:geranylgeranyl diphosphate synthase type II